MQATSEHLRRTRIRKRDRRRRAGMTLIEVMIVMVIMSLVAVAAGFAVMPVLDRSRVRQAQTDAKSIRQMVITYQIEYAECPSVQDLLDKQILSSSTATTDPWGNPWTIACDDVEPSVISAGKDSELNTEDDIT